MIVRFDKVIAEMIEKAPKSMLVALIILAIAASYELGFQVKQDLLGVEEQATTQTEKKYYKVTRVVDGDTLRVDVDGKDETIRLIGINTPETVDPRRTVECFGKEASMYLNTLLPKGSGVTLVSDKTQSDTDTYGRLLRYIEVGSSTDIGLTMITNGFAYQYLYKRPYEKYQLYVDTEKKARAEKVGLWGAKCLK